MQAAPGGVHAGDRDLVAEGAAGGLFDVRLVQVDVRQDCPAQRQEQQHEGEIGEQHGLDREAEHVVRGQVGIAVGRLQAVPALGQRWVATGLMRLERRHSRVRDMRISCVPVFVTSLGLLFRVVHQGAQIKASP
jgi:hypothetical protein